MKQIVRSGVYSSDLLFLDAGTIKSKRHERLAIVSKDFYIIGEENIHDWIEDNIKQYPNLRIEAKQTFRLIQDTSDENDIRERLKDFGNLIFLLKDKTDEDWLNAKATSLIGSVVDKLNEGVQLKLIQNGQYLTPILTRFKTFKGRESFLNSVDDDTLLFLYRRADMNLKNELIQFFKETDHIFLDVKVRYNLNSDEYNYFIESGVNIVNDKVTVYDKELVVTLFKKGEHSKLIQHYDDICYAYRNREGSEGLIVKINCIRTTLDELNKGNLSPSEISFFKEIKRLNDHHDLIMKRKKEDAVKGEKMNSKEDKMKEFLSQVRIHHIIILLMGLVIIFRL